MGHVFSLPQGLAAPFCYGKNLSKREYLRVGMHGSHPISGISSSWRKGVRSGNDCSSLQHGSLLHLQRLRKMRKAKNIWAHLSLGWLIAVYILITWDPMGSPKRTGWGIRSFLFGTEVVKFEGFKFCIKTHAWYFSLNPGHSSLQMP